jgi:tRNA dimethylallyltransferase
VLVLGAAARGPDTGRQLTVPNLRANMGTAPLLLLAGPTAVGKSELALLLAERLGGEIVSVDSMQVYRGMDIGTAKPGPAERARVPHHLLDAVEVSEAFDAARFVSLAGPAISDIQARGRVPILCGGTGLYFNALLKGLGTAPPTDPAVRAQLEAAPLDELLDELARSDPATYARIDRRNPRRVIRALEVIRLTGKPYGAQRADWRAPGAATRGFGLLRPPQQLHQRIEVRVDAMFRAGLVEETRALLARGLGENQVASQALGYRQVIDHLRGEATLAETILLVKTRTRQFAKRQMTWFKRQLELEWLDLEDSTDPVSRIAARAQSGS